MIKSMLGIGLLFLFILLGACQSHPYSQGELIYKTFCLNCHMEDGNGIGELYPGLSNSAYLDDRRSDELPCLIRNGVQSDRLSTLAMPGQKEMSAASMTNLINYVNYKWGNQQITTLEKVKLELAYCSE